MCDDSERTLVVCTVSSMRRARRFLPVPLRRISMGWSRVELWSPKPLLKLHSVATFWAEMLLNGGRNNLWDPTGTGVGAWDADETITVHNAG